MVRSGRALGIALALSLMLTGCGESSKIYAASKSEGVFFSVPKSWRGLSTEIGLFSSVFQRLKKPVLFAFAVNNLISVRSSTDRASDYGSEG